MKNYSRAGYVRTIIAAAAIVSGEVFQSGAKAAIAIGDIVNGDAGEAVVAGVFAVKKRAGLALVQGDQYGYDVALGEIVPFGDAAEDFVIGEADAAALAGDEVGYILLNGIPYAFN